jgi:5-dehydro-4-deoxyglucarate dehydratase
LTSIPRLVGWKDGQGDIRRLQMIINHVGARLHWIGGAGDDMVAAYFGIGVNTFSSSIATVAPRLSLRLWELADAGDSEALRICSNVVWYRFMRCARVAGVTKCPAMKAMMDMVGLNGGPVRPPLANVRPEEEDELRTILATWEKFL